MKNSRAQIYEQIKLINLALKKIQCLLIKQRIEQELECGIRLGPVMDVESE